MPIRNRWRAHVRRALALTVSLSAVLMLLLVEMVEVGSAANSGSSQPNKSASTLNWDHKIPLQTGKVDYGAPFAPGKIQVIHTENRTIDQVLVAHGLSGPATRVNREPFTAQERRVGLDRSYSVAVPAGLEKTEVVRLATFTDDFMYVGLFWNFPGEAGYTPNDSMFPAFQGNLDEINIRAAWDRTRGSFNTRIAVIDSGFLGTHEELANKQVNGYDYFNGIVTTPGVNNDTCTHGSLVGSVAGGATDNARGIAAAGFDSAVFSLRTWSWNSSVGRCNIYWSTNNADRQYPIRYAVQQGAKIINMSYGFTGPSADENLALQAAWESGVTPVAIAMNDGVNVAHWPCAAAYVLCVGAGGADGSKASFSNWGTWVDYAAGGAGIWGACGLRQVGFGGSNYCFGGNADYAPQSGTSLAAPQVAGVLALMAHLGCGPQRQHDWLAATVQPDPNDYWAFGFINAGEALARAVCP